MKPNERINLKAASKNLKTERKPGSGGARPGAGRKKQFDRQQMSIEIPELLMECFRHWDVQNKTGYISYLIAADMLTHKLPVSLKKKVFKLEKELLKFYC